MLSHTFTMSEDVCEFLVGGVYGKDFSRSVPYKKEGAKNENCKAFYFKVID